MSAKGVFAVDRGIFSDPDFADEPFTEREAFIWLISEAAWKAHTKRADGKVISLKRGQLCHSVRFMAEAWAWSKSRVDRFLGRLEGRDIINRDRGTRTPVVTICNYERFQKVSLPEWDNNGTATGTTAGQQRDKLESIEIKEITKLPERARDDFDGLAQKLEEASGGKIHSHSLLVVGPIIELIVSGVSLDLDIIPSVKAASLKLNRTVRLEYFIPVIRQAYERRVGAVKDMVTAPEIKNTDADWLRRLKFGRTTKLWSISELGPMPGQRGCKVPAHLLDAEDGKGWNDMAQPQPKRSAA